MPYIPSDSRMKFNEAIEAIPDIDTAGELNYLLTETILKYVKQHGISYRVLNDVSGALTNCNFEFNRRIVSPYEDKKIAENGDVYEQKF